MHDTKLNIFQRLHLVQGNPDAIYVKKSVESGAGKDKNGVARDVVVAMVKKPLNDAGIYFSTSQISGITVMTGKKSSNGNELIRYEGWYETTFFNIDDPKDHHTVKCEAHGNDYGDKAPGKANTYAEKLNLLKGLGIETGINDEGRNYDEWLDAGVEQEVQEAAPPHPKRPIEHPKAAEKKTAAAEVPDHDGKEDTSPKASPGLIKMIKAFAKEKGVEAAIEAKLKKQGKTYDDLTKDEAGALLTWLKTLEAPVEA